MCYACKLTLCGNSMIVNFFCLLCLNKIFLYLFSLKWIILYCLLCSCYFIFQNRFSLIKHVYKLIYWHSVIMVLIHSFEKLICYFPIKLLTTILFISVKIQKIKTFESRNRNNSSSVTCMLLSQSISSKILSNSCFL